MCPVWLRNAAVPGDRGALCGPYVTTGCLGAAHRAGASDSTPATCVTVTSGAIHDQKNLSARGRDPPRSSRVDPPADLVRRLEAVILSCRFIYTVCVYRNRGFQCLPDSWRARDEDIMCVCVSQLEDELGVVGERQRGELVQLCEGSGVKSRRGSLTHTLRPWALSHIYTMRLRRPGFGPGATGSRFSHSGAALHPCRGLGLGPCHGAQSGWPLHCSIVSIIISIFET